jgi:putative membrane protein
MNAALIGSGIAVLCFAWFGPWRELAQEGFVWHMAMHVSVVAVASPLIAAGLAGAAGLRIPRFLLAPVPASLFEFVVVWGWHFPALHHLARSSSGALVAEQACFLGAGLLLWTSALRSAHDDGRGAGILALLLTSMHMILLGTLLALAPRPLYHDGDALAAGALLVDQQLGGMLMLAGGGVPYLLGALWLVWGLLQAPQTAAAPPARSR